MSASGLETMAPLFLGPVALLGALIGSFLNVVAYRLPRGLSIGSPRWSFCPCCGAHVCPADNLPVISWLRLGRRCRDCRAPIPLVYPVVELLAALVFALVWDALFVGRVRDGIGAIGADWPVALGYLALFAGLLACSVMDIEDYMIDVRVTNVLMLIGVACHSAWGATRAHSAAEYPFNPATVFVGLAMLLGWTFTVLAARVARLRMPGDHGQEPLLENAESAASSDAAAEATAPAAPSWPVWLLVLGIAAYLALATPAGGSILSLPGRAALGLMCVMIAAIAAGMKPRASDDAMHAAIVAEQPRARRTAWTELAWLVPTIGAAVAAGWIANRAGVGGWGSWSVRVGSRPADVLAAGGCAAASMMFAAAIGWTVRIVFTLAFGKEAYGVGDIYLMAAIGAVGGVWLVLLSFFLGAMLALVGVLAFWLRKSSRALPFGPWLSLGALVGLWVHDPVVAHLGRSLAGLRMMLAGQ